MVNCPNLTRGIPTESKSLGRSTKAHMLMSLSDLPLERSNCKGLDDSPGWLRFALGLDAKCHPDSSLGCWLKTGLDPAEARNGEDAILLDLCCSKGCQAFKEPRTDFRLQLMLLSDGLDERTLCHDFACLHGLHCLIHWSHDCEKEIEIKACSR